MDNDYSMAVRTALMAVMKQREHIPKSYLDMMSPTTEQERRLLGTMLISSSESWNPSVLDAIDEVYKLESRTREVIRHEACQPCANFLGTDVCVWTGDKTNLAVDSIVNVVHSTGLGCFQTDHCCHDNCIHRKAGPRLRMECKAILEIVGQPLVAGGPAIVTHAYHLPCVAVLHVKGISVEGAPTASGVDLIEQGYMNVFQACADHGIQTVALNSLSSGLSSDQAAQIAVRAAKMWVRRFPNRLHKIIFCASSGTEEDSYLEAVRSSIDVEIA